MFSASKYYEYIKSLEKFKTAIYIIYGVVGLLVTIISANILIILMGIGIGLGLAHIQTIGLKIKIQKMYWEIEMYNKMNKIAEK